MAVRLRGSPMPETRTSMNGGAGGHLPSFVRWARGMKPCRSKHQAERYRAAILRAFVELLIFHAGLRRFPCRAIVAVGRDRAIDLLRAFQRQGGRSSGLDGAILRRCSRDACRRDDEPVRTACTCLAHFWKNRRLTDAIFAGNSATDPCARFERDDRSALTRTWRNTAAPSSPGRYSTRRSTAGLG